MRLSLRRPLFGVFLLTGNWFFYIYVLNTVSIKAASMAYLVCPILTTVLSFFLLRERLNLRQWGAVGLSAVGYRGPVPSAPMFYILIAVIAVCLTIIPLLLSLYGLERLSSSTVAIILYINPLMGFVVAVTCFGERIDWQQGLAYGIIVVSIILFNWRNPVFADKGARVAGSRL
jgi:chloramphenicol-sensitive protein RarD